MNTPSKNKKKPPQEKKNPTSHQKWLEYKKVRNKRNKEKKINE